MNHRTFLGIVAFVMAGISPILRAEHYEVFLLAGQSNMDGRGSIKDLTGSLKKYAQPNPDILIHFSAGGLKRPLTTSGGFKPLEPGYSGTPGNHNPKALPTNSFGPEVAFGPEISKALPGKHILLVKFAEGGTNLSKDWNPEAKGKLYENFIKFVRQTQEMMKANGDTCEIRGMAWHQGESDAGMPAGKYEEALTAFIAKVRDDLGNKNLPFVIGQVFDNSTRAGIVNDQKATAKAVANVGFVDADGLETFDKGTHFDAASQIKLGKRLADEMIRLMK
jgi:iduronate 2-sulfatase